MAPLDIYVVTFNCGKALVDVNAFSAHLFKPYHDYVGDGSPDLIVLSLQEIAPIAHCFLGSSFSKRWIDTIIESVKHAAPQVKYRIVVTHHAGTTAVVMLIKEEIAQNIQWIETADVGTGWWGMANKGAAGVRIGYAANSTDDVVALTFVAAHLAAGEAKVAKRNSDWEHIAKNLAFVSWEPSLLQAVTGRIGHGEQEDREPLLAKKHGSPSEPSGIFTTPSVVFFAGDLNYRTSDVGPKNLDHRSFPQPTYSIADKKHFSHLLQHDQLSREKTAGRTLHNLAEPPIQFPPTYKYSLEHYNHLPNQTHGADVEPHTWHWAPHRFPSWCDRIFYSSDIAAGETSFKVFTYTSLPIQPTTDHRPVVLAARLVLDDVFQAAKEHAAQYAARFPLNPQATQRRAVIRMLEFVVGIFAYLGWTRQGNVALLASALALLGGWYILKSQSSS